MVSLMLTLGLVKMHAGLDNNCSYGGFDLCKKNARLLLYVYITHAVVK